MIDKRSDLSRYLVHLTRDYNSKSACDNLINILKTKRIEARNYHCLFSPKIRTMTISGKLKSSFKTVCFTETPLNQIKNLVSDIPKRNIKLQPYGIVFWRDQLLDKGANPAIYLNAKGTGLRDHLIKQFDTQFKDIKTLRKLKRKDDYYYEIIQYFSLINVINDKYDFSWEREWRFHGDLKFNYRNMVAIVCEDPEEFESLCEGKLQTKAMNFIKRTPLISPEWNYEQVIEELSIKLWDMKPKVEK
ncbi:MAG: hypothetical protein J7L73_05115 [Anaerolineales bacterium]|nr:hypothetical protein [Anaerolineales bacterium]